MFDPTRVFLNIFRGKVSIPVTHLNTSPNASVPAMTAHTGWPLRYLLWIKNPTAKANKVVKRLAAFILLFV